MSNLPAVGSMVHSVSGPSMEMNGVVLSHVESQWGDYALVLMHDGETKRCNGLNSRPGIGWHAGSHPCGYRSELPEMDYSNYD